MWISASPGSPSARQKAGTSASSSGGSMSSIPRFNPKLPAETSAGRPNSCFARISGMNWIRAPCSSAGQLAGPLVVGAISQVTSLRVGLGVLPVLVVLGAAALALDR